MENIELQPLPLERQIAIFKLAKTEYKNMVATKKEICPNFITGLCKVLHSLLVRFNILKDSVDGYRHIAKVLPIFNISDCTILCRKYRYVIPKDFGLGYWYPRDKYQYRINLLNAIIKELTNQLNK